MLLVMDPGALSTVQDLGRPGFGSMGIPPSGAMDMLALRAANRIAGNDEGAAACEFTMSGPSIAFERDAVAVLTGSRFASRVLRAVTGSAFERDVDAIEAPWDEAFIVRAGETLEVGKTTQGARGYLAVRGGLQVDLFLGSRATQVAAGVGGRTLAQGDRIEIGSPQDAPLRRLAGSSSVYRRDQIVHALRGPQSGMFTDDSLARFFSQEFTISTRADRTGIRLEGSPLSPNGDADIDPEGVVTGAVQVPPDGHPIVLCNDRPATGGYAKIAVVVAADARVLAHVKPGDTLRFHETDAAGARAMWQEQEARLLDMIEDMS